MIFVRNNSVLSSALAMAATGAIVPFDTIVANTNNLLVLTNNTIQEKATGFFQSECHVTLANPGASAVTVTLTAYLDGTAATGATTTVTIDAGETDTLSLSWIQQVVNASSGYANVSWYVSGGSVNLTNASAKVSRVV